MAKKIPLSLPKPLADRLPDALGGGGAGVVPVVRLHGMIASGGAGFGRVLSAESVEEPLRRAFTAHGAKAVALLINSPGGSPTQSEYIGARIRQLASEHELPVLAFCEDVAASGGYWLACAADEIYATATSVVGSVGVISAGFGFSELIDRMGIERRLHSAGEAKARLDPFFAEKSEDVRWLEQIQEGIHDEFRNWVIERRGDKLKATEEELFNGEVWLGRRAVELGVVDGIGTLREVVEKRFPDATIELTGPRRSLFAKLGVPAAGWDDAVAAVVGATRARVAWSRYGL
ncbi:MULTISPECIES: S49 family peptidase [Rhodococcus]|nr:MULTISPECIES: S49 family peptidase [Rhodococcus]MDV7243047.1 S49 family peptidase [Rhodococcus oxybenzonivorans]MDV7275451.1 S49 family peptidase [Rhodococcus oxybenzonivorans]MDV7334694.1 S49 family peptidase [Rhodococcus oxybenzonivorans]MDV7344848.1 S49 family peptidase [Rhodococcus oxybenzonivorans]MDV8029653.1 S49 family peptidase [Rhodococcus sp. IEGM 27]